MKFYETLGYKKSLTIHCLKDCTNYLKQHYPGEDIGLKFIPSQSELFRFIPISVSEPMRIIPNQSEKRLLSRLMKNGQKSIRLIPKPSLILIENSV